ncbi:glycosyltransferase [Roseiarcus fermentans]|uniref:glycosyltransferase n=1 Tax=Roseiarcus fermentans TaxID=1473586 RepID=UPI00147433FB|nr:glycosyltransferase [Roseiarcus fermentans]
MRRARRSLHVHFDLTFNAGALALATAANGAFGFVYWWAAARDFAPAAVGLGSAAISLMLLLSVAADIGFGTLLQGEIPRDRTMAPHLVAAALAASLASAGAFGLAYLVAASLFAHGLGVAPEASVSTRLLVVVGVCLQTVTAVLDAALIGMLQASLRLLRNLLFSVAKLVVLIGFAAIAIREEWQVDAIVGSWALGQLVATLGLVGLALARGVRIWAWPRFDLLWRLGGIAFWHYVLNVASIAPSLILPLIIALVVSPAQNAAFYAAWMLLSLASVLPAALANVLFTVGAGDSSSRASSVRFSLLVSLGVGAVAATGFGLLSNVLLGLLNPVYPGLVGSDLRFLGLSVPLLAVKVHYMTVQRLDGKIRRAALALAAFGAVEVLFAAMGAKIDGLFGATAGWLLAMGVEAACLSPALWRATAPAGARRRGRAGLGRDAATMQSTRAEEGRAMAANAIQEAEEAGADGEADAPASFSIVICVHTLDRWPDVCDAVRSAQAQDLPAREIVVVVDHNRALYERCRTAFGDVVVVENRGQKGLSAARNTGVAVSGGRIVAFLDDDAVAEPGWLAAMSPWFDDARVCGVGSAAHARWIGARPSWFPDEFLWVVGCAYRGLEAGEVRNGLGCAMGLRRSIFERVGGFDPRLGRNGSRLPISCEETEFSLRAARAIPGAKFVYAPGAGVAHKVPAERLTFAYFVLRCFAEGVSKARVAKLAGARSLATERGYVLGALMAGVARGAAGLVVRLDVRAGARAAAIVAGLASTVSGYAWETLGLPAGRSPPPPGSGDAAAGRAQSGRRVAAPAAGAGPCARSQSSATR